ncbi:MAG: hypothetical protein Q7T55_15165, partial [Solirubrobacteraceae bacterium]|nr:hypothetical protein [Solirubrobacteraceae bacterium]
MPDGRPHPTTDELLDAFITAWHAGEAPSATAFEARADDADRDELAGLIAGFLELAPTVQPTEARAAELAGDPLVERIVALEAGRWDDAAEPVAAAADAVAAGAP